MRNYNYARVGASHHSLSDEIRFSSSKHEPLRGVPFALTICCTPQSQFNTGRTAELRRKATLDISKGETTPVLRLD